MEQLQWLDHQALRQANGHTDCRRSKASSVAGVAVPTGQCHSARAVAISRANWRLVAKSGTPVDYGRRLQY
eukprot:5147352-Amphidinium_carterae.2